MGTHREIRKSDTSSLTKLTADLEKMFLKHGIKNQVVENSQGIFVTITMKPSNQMLASKTELMPEQLSQEVKASRDLLDKNNEQEIRMVNELLQKNSSSEEMQQPQKD